MKNRDDEERLSTEEIEAILEREAAGLPPKVDEADEPVKLVMREPGKGRFGRLIVGVLIAFVLLGAYQALHRLITG
ncbi:MAG TPA: hypothetical protein VK996_13300 [Ramlibacter sp.]|nr:hypothetical protein [Ramlibacter sp.]